MATQLNCLKESVMTKVSLIIYYCISRSASHQENLGSGKKLKDLEIEERKLFLQVQVSFQFLKVASRSISSLNCTFAEQSDEMQRLPAQ